VTRFEKLNKLIKVIYCPGGMYKEGTILYQASDDPSIVLVDFGKNQWHHRNPILVHTSNLTLGIYIGENGKINSTRNTLTNIIERGEIEIPFKLTRKQLENMEKPKKMGLV
jgi:hypothetical protein